MYYRRNGRKKYSCCVILAIGALAAVGAVTVTKSGKKIMSEALTKAKGLINKGKKELASVTDTSE